MATVLYPYGSGFVSSACDNCGKFHGLTAVGQDGNGNLAYWCMYGAGGGGTPALVTTVTIDRTSPLPAPVAAAIQSGAIVRD
ncbi:MAG: hypothetical protein ABSF77_19775 [Spirochaetia bacterium]|jgi:hypothetical protein